METNEARVSRALDELEPLLGFLRQSVRGTVLEERAAQVTRLETLAEELRGAITAPAQPVQAQPRSQG